MTPNAQGLPLQLSCDPVRMLYLKAMKHTVSALRACFKRLALG